MVGRSCQTSRALLLLLLLFSRPGQAKRVVQQKLTRKIVSNCERVALIWDCEVPAHVNNYLSAQSVQALTQPQVKTFIVSHYCQSH